MGIPMAERLNDTAGDMIALMQDPSDFEPRPAPLNMPRQVLERPQAPSLLDRVSRLFMRNA